MWFGANKSLGRDFQVLLKMIDNVNSARDVIVWYKVDFNASFRNYLGTNKDAMDLCSLYMAQFGEKVKLLTDETKSSLSSIVDLNIMKYFRNVIDYDYESVNKVILVGYIQSLVSNTFLIALQNRAKYYSLNKRK